MRTKSVPSPLQGAFDLKHADVGWPLQTLFKKLSAQRPAAPERLSAEAGSHTFHVLNQGGVCFLTLAEKSYPKKLAYQYLEELSSEFNRLYGGQQIDSVSRPYAFIKFGVCLIPQMCVSKERVPACARGQGQEIHCMRLCTQPFARNCPLSLIEAVVTKAGS